MANKREDANTIEEMRKQQNPEKEDDEYSSGLESDNDADLLVEQEYLRNQK